VGGKKKTGFKSDYGLKRKGGFPSEAGWDKFFGPGGRPAVAACMPGHDNLDENTSDGGGLSGTQRGTWRRAASEKRRAPKKKVAREEGRGGNWGYSV